MSHMSTQKPSYKGSDLHCELQLHHILWQKSKNHRFFITIALLLSLSRSSLWVAPYTQASSRSSSSCSRKTINTIIFRKPMTKLLATTSSRSRNSASSTETPSSTTWTSSSPPGFPPRTSKAKTSTTAS